MMKKREEIEENMLSTDQDINQKINGLTLLSPFQETDVASSSYTRGSLGLTLSKTASFKCLLEACMCTENQAQPLVVKLKASNFPINSLQIGDWQIISTKDGHLTAKLYYAKQKIVWEILEGPVKRKMEIQWSDITGINAVMPEDQPGTLRIQLDKPPLFFKEMDPQPKKHTMWQQEHDFTCGNATVWRTHCLSFPPGVLNSHYEKLLHCYKELVELSRKPVSSHEKPFFTSAARHLALPEILHLNPHGFQPPAAHCTFTTPTGPPIMTPNPTTPGTLHYMNVRVRNHQWVEDMMNKYHMISYVEGRSSMFPSEVMLFDEIAPPTQYHISTFLNHNNNNSGCNNHRQMMMDYQLTDYAMPMGEYATPVLQPLNCMPHNAIATEVDDFIDPPFVSPDNLTTNANIFPDQHLLLDNDTGYGTPFQNQRHLLPDNDLTTHVNPNMDQNQHAFLGNLTTHVNHHMYQNQNVFPDHLSRGNSYRK